MDRLAELFPSVVTEALDEGGKPKRAIDFDVLRDLLSDDAVEGRRERYQFTWPGKAKARQGQGERIELAPTSRSER